MERKLNLSAEVRYVIEMDIVIIKKKENPR